MGLLFFQHRKTVVEYQWLKQKREAAGLTQKQVADSYGVDASQIGKMGKCHQQAPQRVRYIDLAKILGVEVITLIQHHIRDLTTAHLPKHLDSATAALKAYMKEKSVPPVNYHAIEKALNDTNLKGLVRQIGERKPYAVDATGQAKHIADLLHEGEFSPFNRYLKEPLKDMIGEAADENELVAVANFLRAILCECHVNRNAIKMGEINWANVSQDAWELKIAVDTERKLDGVKTLFSDSENHHHTLNTSYLSTRAIHSGTITEGTVDERVYFWIVHLSKLLGLEPPPLTTDSTYDSHCAALNLRVEDENDGNDYVFGIFKQARQEPDEVKIELNRKLRALTLFDTFPSSVSSNAVAYETLRLEKEYLQYWYARLLHMIDLRKGDIINSTYSSNRDKVNEGDDGEKSSNTPSTTVNVHIVNEVNLYQSTLQKVLIETDADNSEHIIIRKIVRDMQSDVEGLGEVSPEKQKLFQKMYNTLPSAVQALESVSKLVDLFTKHMP